VRTVSKILVSSQAYSSLIGLSPEERRLVSRAFRQLETTPELGLKLWGREDLFLYQTATETRMVYKLSPGQVQILALKPARELPLLSRAKISAIVLAAGRADYGDARPVCSVAESFLAAGVDDLIVVLGYQAEQAKAALKDKEVKVIINPEYEHGLSLSLRYGLRMLSRDTQAVLLTLGNRPFIKPGVVADLVSTYQRERASVVAPTYFQVRGHPVVFDALLVPELLRAKGNVGGRGVLYHHRQELRQVEVADAGVVKRIDSWLN
jgi:molybdenum cofactor cytidylyltransferase